MRPLTEEETKTMFDKLAKYIGAENIKLLVDRSDGTYCFRLHRERVYYVSEKIMKQVKCDEYFCTIFLIYLLPKKCSIKPLILPKKAGNVARENLISLGTCFGKFTKTRKFRLHITSLDFLAPYASYKLWLKASAEQQFLYGHNVTKSGLGRITENTDKYQVLNVLTMDYLFTSYSRK